MQTDKFKIYFSLFKISFSISAFTFGGGYIVIPMMRRHFVTDLDLITEEELLDMAAIAQSAPEAIAVNLAVLVGYKIAGLSGAIISCVGTILPPLLILSVLSAFYKAFRDNRHITALLKGMEAGVAAAIVDIVVDMWQQLTKERNWLFIFLAPSAFIAGFFCKVNVLIIILVSALTCLTYTWAKNKMQRSHL